MNSTKSRNKGRKIYMQRVRTVNEEFALEHVDQRIDESTNTIAISLNYNQSLLLRAINSKNLNAACCKVIENNGKGGVDGINVGGLIPFLRVNGSQIQESIRNGKYKPNPVRRVEIPKDEPGKYRMLGIPTCVDRVIQQGIAQVLTPIYELAFSDYSFGFRPGLGCHDALRQVMEYANEGYSYVVDMDLEKYFDTVNHSKLIEILSRTIKDGELISLIHKYLNAGAWSGGMFKRTEEGVPQGGPLSPLLGNIMLNELDQELMRRGHKFVRYADDTMILCKSRKAAERTMDSITEFIEEKLFLKVNREKTCVAELKDVKFLGYGFYQKKGEYRLRVHQKSIKKLKDKIREVLSRHTGYSNEIRIIKWGQKMRGWIQYFKLADMKGLMKEMDGWARRHIRAIYWRQWKRVRTRYERLRKLGISGVRLHEMANCRKGTWRAAMMLNSAITNKVISDWGFLSLYDYYLKVR